MARIMDFVHDDSGSHKTAVVLSANEPDEDDNDLLNDVKDGPEEGPYEDEDAESEPVEPDQDGEEEVEEPDEESGSSFPPEPKAARRRQDPLKGEMDRLVAESQRAQQLEARLAEQERRAQIAELGAIKSHAALKSREFETIRRELDEAIELGEVSKQSELRDKYYDTRSELQQLGAYIQRQEQTLSQPAAPPAHAAPPPNPKAVAWTKRQSWWGKDKKLTSVAFTIDDELIAEGVNPYSDVFYQELQKRLAPYMPRSDRRRQAVAGVDSRSTAPSRTKVRLSEEDRAMARRLDVPPEEFAKYVGI